MPVSEEENARQATLDILKILDKYNLSERQARIIFDIIMDDYTYTSRGFIKKSSGGKNE